MPSAETLAVEIEREEDGRWVAEVPALPGVLAYGGTSEEAQVRAEALALRVMAERREHGEAVPQIAGLFEVRVLGLHRPPLSVGAGPIDGAGRRGRGAGAGGTSGTA